MTIATNGILQNAEGVLIWVGPGDAARLPTFNPSNYSHVLLIESDELQQEKLLRLRQANSKITVLHLSVTVEDGPALLYRYNLSQFNALQPATGLLKLYPGLKLQEQVNVRGTGFSTLVSEQQLAPIHRHSLVLSVPAQALELLKSLAEKRLLTQFAQLTVQVGVIELYQGAGTCLDLESWLLQQGYVSYETDQSDPDLRLITYRRHTLLEKAQKLELDRQQLTTQLVDSYAELDKKEAELEALQLTLQHQVLECAEIQKLLKNQQKEFLEQQQGNTTLVVRISQIEELHRTELQAIREQQRQATEVAAAERTTAKTETEQLRNQLQAFESQLRMASSSKTELLAAIERLNTQKNIAEQTVMELQQQLKQSELAITEAHSSAVETTELRQHVELLTAKLLESDLAIIEARKSDADLEIFKQQVLSLEEKLQQSDLAIIEANKSAGDKEQLKHQLQSLEVSLQIVTAENAKLLETASSIEQQKIQSEQAFVELLKTLEQKLLQAEHRVVIEREASEVLIAQLRAQLQTEEHQLQAVIACKAELAAKVESLQSQTVRTETSVAELQQQLDSCIINLSNATTHATHRLNTINQLETTNRRLLDENQQLNARQQALQQEMLKAEAQIDLIKELILKE